MDLNIQYEQRSPSTVVVSVRVSPEELQACEESVLRSLSASLKVPGFRPGKVPLSVVRARYSPEEIRGQALEDLKERAIRQFLKTHGKVPINDYEWSENPNGAGLILQTTLEIIPDAELEDYKNIKVTVPELPAPSERDVDERIAIIQENNSDLVPAEGAAQKDYVVVVRTREGKVRLVRVPEEPEERRVLTGRMPGDEVEVEIMTRAGPEKVGGTVEKVLRSQPPSVEELAKRLGLESVERLREEVRKELQAERDARQDEMIREAVLSEFLKRIKIGELPGALVEEEVSRQKSRALAQAGGREEDLRAAIMERYGKMEVWEAELLAAARRNVMLRLGLEQVARNESLKVYPEDEEKEIRKLAVREGVTARQMRSRLEREDLLGSVRAQIRWRKAEDFLVEHAEITMQKAG
jgi:trigger factor